MMNYMEEIAKMLGVELNKESFKIYNNITKEFLNEGGTFTLRSEGLIFNDGGFTNAVLVGLLNGENKIVKLPFIPEENEKYYWVVRNAHVTNSVFNGSMFDIYNIRLGNCYKTKDEAERHIDEWTKFFSTLNKIEVRYKNENV